MFFDRCEAVVTFEAQTHFMKRLFLLLTLFISVQSFSQYFYNDIIGTAQSNKQHQLLQANKVKKIIAKSFDADNSESEGFSLTQEFSNGGNKLVTASTTSAGNSSLLTSIYNAGKIRKTEETSARVSIKIEYTYDDAGRIQQILSTTTDTAVDHNNISTEAHQWFYKQDGQPDKMWKIANKTDTTFLTFVYDEKGNVAEEHWRRYGKETEVYFYYYDAKGQVTDIVRYNSRARKMLPDYMYEYDEQGKITQMIQLPAGTSKYFTWRYAYNEKGLKTKEACFDKERQLLGKVEYTYE